VYMQVFLRKGTYTAKRVPDMGHTIENNFQGFSVVVFISMGYYPYYGSRDFIIIKSS
jgi:hypothetical protein